MGKLRKLISKKKLGGFRIDIHIAKKREFIKRIIENKEPYKTINEDIRKLQKTDEKKSLPRSTYNLWRTDGPKYLG